MAKYSIIDNAGSQQELEVTLQDYEIAGKKGVSLSQHLESRAPSKADGPTTFQQCMAASGLYMSSHKRMGLQPPTMEQVLNDSVLIDKAGSINRNDGANSNTPSGRLLFPEIILQTIASELEEDYSDFTGAYNQMVAQTQNINGPKFDQPIVNATAPRDVDSQPISQLAEPTSLVSITVSDVTRRIPTKSIGLTVSDEALQSTTLDIVGIALTQQARYERIRRIEADIVAMVAGDVDSGESAITNVNSGTYDSAANSGANFTHKAWIKFLRNNYRKRSINWIITGLDEALYLEGRAGKPVMAVASGDGRVDANGTNFSTAFSVENLGITPPRLLLVEQSLLGANVVVGLDSRYAIRRVINVSASYQAIENYVMRRATSMRFDFGEMSHKLFTEAWSKMTFAAA